MKKYRIAFKGNKSGTPIAFINATSKEEAKEKFEKINPEFVVTNVDEVKSEVKSVLHDIKEELFDAPSEVKEAFNTVVGYFDKSFNPNNWYVIAPGAGVVLKKFKTKEEAISWAGKGKGKKVISGEEAIRNNMKYKTSDQYQG